MFLQVSKEEGKLVSDTTMSIVNVSLVALTSMSRSPEPDYNVVRNQLRSERVDSGFYRPMSRSDVI